MVIQELIDSRYGKKYGEHSNSEELVYGFQENSGLLIVEENAMLIIEMLNIDTFERTRDVIQLDYVVREDIELTILVTREEYQFRLVTVEWTKGSYAPVKTSKLWKRLNIKGMKQEEIKEKLKELIDGAIKKMEDYLITCKYCKGKFPAYHTINGKVCHTCAVKYLNVVF